MSRFTLSTGDVTTITFDDGGMNVLSSEALDELRVTIERVARATSIVLFRSGSTRIFAAGADMREMSRFGAEEASQFSKAGQDLFDSIGKLPMPTAVFIDGDCFGGALDLALSFDLILATPTSRFSHPGARIGIVTGFGGTSRWRSRLSGAATSRLFLGNGVMNAEEARNLGLVDEVISREGIDVAVSEIAGRAAAIPLWIPAFVRAPDRSERHLLLLARHASDLYSRGQLGESDAALR